MQKNHSNFFDKIKKLRTNLPRLKELVFQDPFDIYSNMPIEVAIYDTDGKYVFVNERYLSDPEISDKIIGEDDLYLCSLMGIQKESLEKRRQHFGEAIETRKIIQFTEKLYFPARNQTLYYKRIFQPLFSSNNGEQITGLCLFGNSLTSVIQAQKELKYLVYHDKLTGLKNREAFLESLDQLIIESDRDTDVNAILICDIDNFKMVNDSFGHRTADDCLKEISNRIHRALRKSDLIFRIGGDEFAIILKNLKQEYDASRIAEKVIQEVTQPFHFKDEKINFLTLTIGIVLTPKDGKDRETLIKKATSALKNAKKIHRNDFQFFSEDLTEKYQKRMEMENNLRFIIHKNSFEQQFKILYQPIVEKGNGGDYRIIGCEALLRWKNPDLGDVSPDIFIPIAEETDLICPLGDWVLTKALKDFKAMTQRIQKQLHISINFSAKQMQTPDIVRKLETVIKETNIDPTDLHLELTETSFLDEGMQVIQNINEIEKLGLKIAIDDFGVGFASLKYLQRFPVSIIKIDRSFIKNINMSNIHKKLVESIIILGKNMNKDIIAEGVENLEHLYVLYTQQCYKYQGYLFSKPVSIEDLEDLVTGKENLYLISKEFEDRHQTDTGGLLLQ
ncbi:MAG: bifunctional diguanylate cyclase/phosphodiesterase [Calditrichaeota bacterium]|nr:bifunctional diguanylate cyclase/phosphodiesterase [Calditrichota bacterium]